MNIKSVIKELESLKCAKNSEFMKRYMKGQFEYFGIKSAERRAIAKPYIKFAQDFSKDKIKCLVLDLYNRPERELHYIALEICIPFFKKHPETTDIVFFEELANRNQWWDTIDVIAPKLMAQYFLVFPGQRIAYIEKWLASKNKWLIRCALIFQLKYKTRTDLDLLFTTILAIPPTGEFFINKAIGWMLRENTRLYPEAIIDFVKDNGDQLSHLSKKEALRLID